MRILGIIQDSIVDGEGLRTVIFVSGCKHHCRGCHNPESWNPNNGTEMSIPEIIRIIESNPLADVTISGGDGLTYQYEDTLKLVKAIKEQTRKNVWLYTGYTIQQVLESKREILDYIDVIVDGRFELENRDISLCFKGSSNQKIVNVKEFLSKL